MHKTILQFTSGKQIELPEIYEMVQELFERAWSEKKLLELVRFDGTTITINPNNIDYIYKAAMTCPQEPPPALRNADEQPGEIDVS